MRQKGLVFGPGRAWKGADLLSFVLIIARVVTVGVPGGAAQAARTGWQRFRLAMFVAVNSGSGKERRIEAREGGKTPDGCGDSIRVSLVAGDEQRQFGITNLVGGLT